MIQISDNLDWNGIPITESYASSGIEFLVASMRMLNYKSEIETINHSNTIELRNYFITILITK